VIRNPASVQGLTASARHREPVISPLAGGATASCVVPGEGSTQSQWAVAEGIGSGVLAQPLLTTREVADLLSVSCETVLRYWRTGSLPGYRLASNSLRFDACDIAAWLEERRYGPPSGVRASAVRGE
jgi:excisionase family DNA binding protein